MSDSPSYTDGTHVCEHCGRDFDGYQAAATYKWRCPSCSYSILKRTVVDANPSHANFPVSRGTTQSQLNAMHAVAETLDEAFGNQHLRQKVDTSPQVATESADPTTELLSKQVGGDHYKTHGTMQPWCIIEHYKLNYWEGSALKYILRSKDPTKRAEDLRKAAHCLEYVAAMMEKQP